MSAAGLHDALLRAGAVLNGASHRALHFGSPAEELSAALDDCALVCRSHVARLIGDGPDLLDLLHRLSTNHVRDLGAGGGTSTVLTTPKGRIVERLLVHRLDDTTTLLLGGPGPADRILDHLARYTFAERTGLRDAGDEIELLALVGPRIPDALLAAELPLPEPGGTVAARHEGRTIHVLGHDGVGPDGVTFVVPTDVAGSIWHSLALAAGRAAGRPAGDEAMEAWRVLRGIPAAPNELNEEHNPLEAGLWSAVSFDKGCYVGQEVVARLNTYDKVARTVLGIEWPPGTSPPEQGSALYRDGRAVGEVTTALVSPGDGRTIGLCYVRRRDVEAGVAVATSADGPADGRLVELPFARR